MTTGSYDIIELLEGIQPDTIEPHEREFLLNLLGLDDDFIEWQKATPFTNPVAVIHGSFHSSNTTTGVTGAKRITFELHLDSYRAVSDIEMTDGYLLEMILSQAPRLSRVDVWQTRYSNPDADLLWEVDYRWPDGTIIDHPETPVELRRQLGSGVKSPQHAGNSKAVTVAPQPVHAQHRRTKVPR